MGRLFDKVEMNMKEIDLRTQEGIEAAMRDYAERQANKVIESNPENFHNEHEKNLFRDGLLFGMLLMGSKLDEAMNEVEGH